MCAPIHRLPIPAGLENCCDAVSSLYLHDRDNAKRVLFEHPDTKNLQDRQDLLDRLKQSCLSDPGARRTLDTWLWGKSTVEEIWDNEILATLEQRLPQHMVSGGQWSLQILPSSLTGVGHHVALGQSPNGTNWWLLDTADGMTVFASSECLVTNLLARLLSSQGIESHSRTVLLKIT